MTPPLPAPVRGDTATLAAAVEAGAIALMDADGLGVTTWETVSRRVVCAAAGPLLAAIVAEAVPRSSGLDKVGGWHIEHDSLLRLRDEAARLLGGDFIQLEDVDAVAEAVHHRLTAALARLLAPAPAGPTTTERAE